MNGKKQIERDTIFKIWTHTTFTWDDKFNVPMRQKNTKDFFFQH